MPRRPRTRRAFGQIELQPASWKARCPDLSKPRKSNGKRTYICRSFPTKKAAESWLRDMQAAFDTGTYKPRVKPALAALTVLEAIDEFLAVKEGEDAAESTLVEYRRTRRRIAENGLGELEVRSVTAADIERFIAWRRDVALGGRVPSASTIARDIAVLSGTFNRLVRHKTLTANPASGVGPRPKTTRRRMALPKEDTVLLVEACSERLRPVVLTALLTGARKNEILMLRWQDIDFDRKAISLTRMKTGKSDSVALHEEVARELQAHHGRLAARLGRELRASDWVFPSPRGTAPWQLERDWKTAVKKAGLSDREGLTFHSLRHTFACHYLEGGAAITDLQAILGHADLKTTQVYAKIVDPRARESVMRMDLGVRNGEE